MSETPWSLTIDWLAKVTPFERAHIEAAAERAQGLDLTPGWFAGFVCQGAEAALDMVATMQAVERVIEGGGPTE